MKRYYVIIFFILGFFVLNAENAKPQKILDQKIIDNFINNMVEIETAFKSENFIIMNVPYNINDFKKDIEKHTSYENILCIVSKYELGENPLDVYVTIMYSLNVIMSETIVKNTYMPEEAVVEAKKVLKNYKKYLHKNDLALIKKNYDKIIEEVKILIKLDDLDL